MNLRNLAGKAVGAALSPLTGAIALVRRARMFHPDGTVYRASVAPLAAEGPLGALADRLQGEAIVRLSSAWWRGGKEWTDVLGLAVRFRGKAVALDAPPWPGDQDLLTATIRSPLTMALAPLTTLQHDYLANDFYAVSPFKVDGLGRAKLRLRSLRHERHAPDPGDEGRGRAERLARAVAAGRAVFHLEARLLPPANSLNGLVASAVAGSSLDRDGTWVPVAKMSLEAQLPVDQAALRFDPFLNGRGMVPTGFVHALRRATYTSSQLARPATATAK